MENKEYKFIDTAKFLSFNQLKKASLENVRTIKLLEEEVKRLRSLNPQLTQKEKEDEYKSNIESLDDEIREDTSILDEIDYYFSHINEIDFENQENLQERILLALPSQKHGNYQNIIYGINARILKDTNEIRNLIESEKESFSIEDLQELKEDIINNQRKIASINQSVFNNLTSNEVNENEEKLNNIVFMETSSGNIYALEDINSIPKEYHEGFYELFTSIQDGTFKNVKVLNNGNRETAGVSEVRGFKKRIIFDRIGYDTYAVIAVFTKKSDKDKGYIDALKNRIAIYKAKRDSLVAKSKDENYMLEQQEILNKIYQKIALKEENKSYEKVVK